MMQARTRAVVTLGIVAIVAGIAAAVNARDQSLFANAGQQLGGLFALNLFGGILTSVLGVAAILGARAGRPEIVTIAGAIFLVGAAITLLRTATTLNFLGGHGATLSFLLMMGVGLVALAISPEADAGSG